MRKQIRESFATFHDALIGVIDRMLRWARLDYSVKGWVDETQDEQVESRLQTVVNAAFGGTGTVTMPLQPFLDLQFEVNAGTGSGVIERAHMLVRAVEFPTSEPVFPETPPEPLKRIEISDAQWEEMKDGAPWPTRRGVEEFVKTLLGGKDVEIQMLEARLAEKTEHTLSASGVLDELDQRHTAQWPRLVSEMRGRLGLF